MIKRRLHIAGARRRGRIRLNDKFDIKKRRRISHRIRNDWEEMREESNPILHVPFKNVEMGDTSDQVFFLIRNRGGQPLSYNIHGFPAWLDVVNMDNQLMSDDNSFEPVTLEVGEYKKVYLKSREENLPSGVTTGTFEIDSNGGTETVTVTTKKGTPPPPAKATIKRFPTSLRVAWPNNWNGTESGAKVNFYISDSSSKPNSPTYTLASDSALYHHTGLGNGVTKHYWVEYENDDGKSTPATVEGTTISIPNADPGNISIVSFDTDSASISWTGNPTNEEGAYVYISTSNTIPGTEDQTLAANLLSASFSSLTPATTYYVWVKYFNSAGDSATSTANFTTQASVPDATPSNIVVSNIENERAIISWTNNCTNASEVRVFVGETVLRPKLPTATLTGTTKSYGAIKLKPGTSYNVWVQFYNTFGTTIAGPTNFTTTGGWVNTQLTVGGKKDIIHDGKAVTLELSIDLLNNYLVDASGISIGDQLEFTNSFGRTEVMSVIDIHHKTGTLRLSRSATPLMMLHVGSPIRINRSIQWYPACTRTLLGKLVPGLTLDMNLKGANKSTEIRFDKPIVDFTPTIRVGDYIKINNEIMGPVAQIGPLLRSQVGLPLLQIGTTNIVAQADPSQKTGDPIIVIAARGALGTIIANHNAGDAVYVNHK